MVCTLLKMMSSFGNYLKTLFHSTHTTNNDRSEYYKRSMIYNSWLKFLILPSIHRSIRYNMYSFERINCLRRMLENPFVEPKSVSNGFIEKQKNQCLSRNKRIKVYRTNLCQVVLARNKRINVYGK